MHFALIMIEAGLVLVAPPRLLNTINLYGRSTMSISYSIEHCPPLPSIAGVQMRHVPGSPGYAVGDDGTVWGCRTRWGMRSWRPLKPRQTEKGYLDVLIGRTHRLVHRLVLEAFIGPGPKGMDGCHFPDPNRANCRLDNLRWDTRASNHADKLLQGSAQRGENNGLHKLTEDDVREVWARLQAGHRSVDIAAAKGVGKTSILAIRNKQNWGWLTDTLGPLGKPVVRRRAKTARVNRSA